MAKLQIEVPQSRIDEAAGKELASARRKIKSLEEKIRKLESEQANAQRAIRAFESFRLHVADNFDLYQDYGF